MVNRLLKLLVVNVFFFCLLLSVVASANEFSEFTVEGYLQDVGYVNSELRLRIDDNWYLLDSFSTLFVCGEEKPDAKIEFLESFIGLRVALTPVQPYLFNEIRVMCE